MSLKANSQIVNIRPLISTFDQLAALGVTRLALFGGTFDPAHLGHLAVAELVFSKLALSHLLILPTGQNPLKTQLPTSTINERLELLELVFSEHPEYLFSDWEIIRSQSGSRPSYTIDTLLALRQVLGSSVEILLILGSDVWSSFGSFHRAAEILKLADVVVVQRPGTQSLSGIYQAKYFLEDASIPDISSTQLRQLLHDRSSALDKILPKKVIEYLRWRGQI